MTRSTAQAVESQVSATMLPCSRGERSKSEPQVAIASMRLLCFEHNLHMPFLSIPSQPSLSPTNVLRHSINSTRSLTHLQPAQTIQHTNHDRRCHISHLLSIDNSFRESSKDASRWQDALPCGRPEAGWRVRLHRPSECHLVFRNWHRLLSSATPIRELPCHTAHRWRCSNLLRSCPPATERLALLDANETHTYPRSGRCRRTCCPSQMA